MKILFDENLSYRVVRELKKTWPECRSLAELGLNESADSVVWRYATENGYIVATYDEDYLDLLALKGAPPKVVYLRLQNATRTQLLEAFQKNAENLVAFADAPGVEVFFLF